MAKILIADSIADTGIELLSDRHEIIYSTDLSEDALIAALKGVQALLVRSQTQVTAHVIKQSPDLEIIGRAGVGVDNIDLDAATQQGITVVNAPLSNTTSTAEHAFALILSVARHIPQAHHSLKNGEWARSKYAGIELSGQTLGIVGLGRIGSEVARKAHAFNMEIIAYDPFVTSDRANQLGVQLLGFDSLLEQSDFLTLHTALHDGTRNLLSTEEFKKMKKTALIINAARGPLVDEVALYAAIDAGEIAGAAIDVFSEEPAVDNILTSSDKIIVTPHLAASTVAAQTRAAVETAEQLIDFFDGKSPRFSVNVPLVDEDTMSIISPFIDCAELAGSVAVQLVKEGVATVRIEYRGAIANYNTSPLRAAVIMGILQSVTEDKVTMVNANAMAEIHGLDIKEDSGPALEPFASQIIVSIFGNAGEAESVTTTHTSGGPRIVGIGSYDVEIISYKGHLLAIENIDRPGKIGHVATLLGTWGININAMSVAAGREKFALMLLTIERSLTEDEITFVRELEDIETVRQIELS